MKATSANVLRVDSAAACVIIGAMGKTTADRTLPGRIFDGAARAAFRAGYRAMRVLWRIRPPHDDGVGVLVRHNGHVLAVRHSYRPGYTIPGGNVGRGEAPRETAVRELAEELSLEADPAALVFRRRVRNTDVYELRLAEEPEIRIDNREIVEAVFLTPAEATRRNPEFRKFM